MTDAIDRQLASLLATPARTPDEGFVSRTEALILFEQRRHAARRSTFRQVALETLAAASVLLVFAVAARIGEASDVVPLFSPAMAGLIALALWCAVSLPLTSSARSRR